MHLVRNSSCVKTTPKEVFGVNRYFTQYGHVKIMPDCLGSVEEVPGYVCYRFQDFISRRAATGKMTHEYTHCVESVQMRSFFWSAFFLIRTEYGEIRS